MSNGVVRTIEQPSIVPEGVNADAAGAEMAPASSYSSSSSSDDGASFGGWGGGGREDVELWMLLFVTLGVTWLVVRRIVQ